MLKRYILFIAMSFLVFWLYAVFFPPAPPVKGPPPETPPRGKGRLPTRGKRRRHPPRNPRRARRSNPRHRWKNLK